MEYTVTRIPGGVEFYTDDDNASGYGYYPKIAYWYTRDQDEIRRILNKEYLPDIVWVDPFYGSDYMEQD